MILFRRGNARLGVVLVNYKRADDTIECLESLLRSPLPMRVVVVDNDSGDGSLDAIAAWAAGDRPPTAASAAMAARTTPALPKPIPIRRLTAAAAEASAPDHVLTLIDAGRNGGFAAGNNIGLRHLRRDPDLAHFWLLNNDTIVESSAAGALLDRMDATANIGMCGTIVRFYWRPDRIQALNGHRFDMLTGTSRGIAADEPATSAFNPAEVTRATDFVLGASLGVSRAFLEATGLMDEGYFLYFEEIDWAVRMPKHFRIAFAHGAIVYHKEGGAIGSSAVPGARSDFSDYWLARSRLRFIRRHRLWLLPWHWLVALSLICRRLVRRQPGKAWAILRATVGLGY